MEQSIDIRGMDERYRNLQRLMRDALREKHQAIVETIAAIDRGIARINELQEERRLREEAGR